MSNTGFNPTAATFYKAALAVAATSAPVPAGGLVTTYYAVNDHDIPIDSTGLTPIASLDISLSGNEGISGIFVFAGVTATNPDAVLQEVQLILSIAPQADPASAIEANPRSIISQSGDFIWLTASTVLPVGAQPGAVPTPLAAGLYTITVSALASPGTPVGTPAANAVRVQAGYGAIQAIVTEPGGTGGGSAATILPQYQNPADVPFTNLTPIIEAQAFQTTVQGQTVVVTTQAQVYRQSGIPNNPGNVYLRPDLSDTAGNTTQGLETSLYMPADVNTTVTNFTVFENLPVGTWMVTLWGFGDVAVNPLILQGGCVMVVSSDQGLIAG